LSKVEVVRLQARKTKGEHIQYLLTAPKDFIENELKWQKGDTLIVRVLKLRINGIERPVLVYYKP